MAANQSSPGVVVQERDLTTITTLTTANTGVIAAPFELGPVEEIKNIGTERELVATFGEPNEYNYEYWYTAAQFLSCLLYTSPSPRDLSTSRMPSSA